MVLIVGLGNPGKSYRLTRHNVGFLLVDRLAERWNVSMKKKFASEIGSCQVSGKKVFLQKPETYMNDSGRAVEAASSYFGEEEILAICDDVALPFGSLRLLEKGGHGGHNGLRDIETCLGTKEYKRLRIGVGAPGGMVLADYVLSSFSKKEQEELEAILDRAVEGIESFLDRGIEEAMKQVNTETK